jgi:flavodoxin
MIPDYQVFVDGVGPVYTGDSQREALATYWESVEDDDYAGKTVTLFKLGGVLKEYRSDSRNV